MSSCKRGATLGWLGALRYILEHYSRSMGSAFSERIEQRPTGVSEIDVDT